MCIYLIIVSLNILSLADYGDSFPDVVKGLGLILESLNLDHSSVPSNFKYKDTLQKQV